MYLIQKSRADYNDVMKIDYEKAQAGKKNYSNKDWLDSPWEGVHVVTIMSTIVHYITDSI